MVESSSSSPPQSPYVSPDGLIKQKDVGLCFDNISHNAKSYDENEKYVFCRQTKDLSVMLERWTPKDARAELIVWYDQLKNEIQEIKESNRTEQDKARLILQKEYEYALEVHEQNMRILMNSPIIEVEAEGELDVSDAEMVEVVRGGKRKDDKSLGH